MFNRVWNPPSRFDPTVLEWDEEPPPAKLKVIPDASRSVLTCNDSPDVGFEWSVNPYRGCTHACSYCYARAFHEYLDLGAGSDFERVILVKERAPELLARALRRPSWKGAPIAFSGVTDCYQPLERKYELTRGCLQVCADFRNPVSIITRSPLVARDLDVLQELAAHDAVRVSFSVPILDRGLCRAIEPGAPPPGARLRAIEALAKAGIPVGVSVSPIIPGLNDRAIPETLERARGAGAQWAWIQLLRLPGSVATVFEARLREALPSRADRVLAGLRRSRGGRLNDPRFSSRMRGTDPTWQVTSRMFEIWRERLGFTGSPPFPDPSPFRRPGSGEQLGLPLR